MGRDAGADRGRLRRVTEREAEIAALAQDLSGLRRVWPDMAVSQDLGLYCDDIMEFIMALADRYGEWVWDWPWARFADDREGVGCLAIFGLPWLLLCWLFRARSRGLHQVQGLERLEIGHIAAVLDRGVWFEP